MQAVQKYLRPKLVFLRDTVMKTVLPCTDQITQPFWVILLTFCGDKIDPGHSGFTSMPFRTNKRILAVALYKFTMIVVMMVLMVR